MNARKKYSFIYLFLRQLTERHPSDMHCAEIDVLFAWNHGDFVAGRARIPSVN
jgi:hypothetical protein